MHNDNLALLYEINLYVIGCCFGNLFHCCSLAFKNQLRGFQKCLNIIAVFLFCLYEPAGVKAMQ